MRETLVAWGPAGVFAAAAIESLGVPNPGGTDALILLVTIARPELVWRCAALAVAGSLAGSVIFHAAVSKGGEKLLERRTASGRGARLRAWFQRYGLASVFVCALVPLPVLPLKGVALCACALGVSRARYLGVIAAARIPRYAGMAYLGARLGEGSSAWLKAHAWALGAAAVGLLAGMYAVLYWAERRRGVRIKDVGA